MDEQRPEHPSGYRIYLLTVWQEPTAVEGRRWRFQLADPQTGRRYGFTNPNAFPHALQQLHNAEQDRPEPTRNDPTDAG